MSAEQRKDLYQTILVNNNKELDYLDSLVNEFNTTNTVIYVVPSWAENRLDIISFIHYRTTRLWWLIAQFNDNLDPIEGVLTGTELVIPMVSDYYTFYNSKSKIDEIPSEGFDKRSINI